MNDTPPPPPVALNQARERTIRQLGEHFAQDHLEAEQLEERVDRALAATTLQELQELVRDLPALHSDPALTAAASPAIRTAPAEQVAERQAVVAIMGGASRKGSWVPPRELSVIAIMGGAELDFREARFGPGVLEVSILALMGGVEITVPPGVHVEVNGVAIMGGFDERASTPLPADPSAPVIRIGGFAFMGGVEVRTRLPGETKGDARRRERVERREARRLHRGE
ncbi:MAG TPA: DUF1707 domain-containing protein [Longimicrobiaceae bacterium]|nr:DUF1707 domain-containing protein [Longimicrobiaceae bacterium]